MILVFFLSMILSWLPFSYALGVMEIGVISFTLYTLGIMILFPVIFLFNFHRYRLTISDLFLVLICVTFLISTILSENKIASGYLAFHSIFIPVVSYMAVRCALNSSKAYKLIIASMVTGITLFSIFAIGHLLTQGMSSRSEIFSMDAIAVGSFAVFALMNLIFAWRAWPPFWQKSLIIAAIIINAIALVSTLSRAYLVLMVLSPILYFLVRRINAFILFITFIVVTLSSTLALTSNYGLFKTTGWRPENENTIERLVSPTYWKTSVYGRFRLLASSFDEFKKKPIFGIGLQTAKGWGSTPHNVHIEWLLYGGILGYLMFFMFFTGHFFSSSVSAKADAFSAINLTTILIILSNGMTNGFMHGLMPYVAFLTMGLNEARMKIIKAEPADCV